MRLVIQRVRKGWVKVEDQVIAEIDRGLVILVGVGQTDTAQEVSWLAKKTAHLRIFEDQGGKTNLSLLDTAREALVVSQFTLYADTSKGRRPSFIHAARPELAEPLVQAFAKELTRQGIPTQMGVFGAHMVVGLENDGPVTIVMEREAE
jgi:D-tyrosyl-tRNA(Tyr) deacylase